MAHMIEDKRMMYVGATPWHGIGTRLSSPPTVEEGIRAAGLDWTVSLEPLMTMDGRPVAAQATVRSFDKSILGVVGPRYTPLQNIDAFRWFQPFLDSGLATLHTAGCLDAGRRVWVLAHVTNSKSEIVPNDRVDSFILLSNSHDGTLAVRVGFTPIRVVCANTLAAAHSDRAGSKLLRVRHTASMNDTLAEIRDVMDLASREFVASVAQYRQLAARHVNAADLRRYVRQVFGAPEKEEETSTRMNNILDAVCQRAETGLGNDLPNVRGTYWAAYNGVTEYLSWARGKDANKRLDSLWFGDGANVSRRAFDLALQLAS